MAYALLTGASGGIGRETARKLMEKGYYVIGIGRNERVLKELTSFGNFDYIIADLSEKGAVGNIRKALEQRGIERLDLIIHNAGFAIAKPLLEQDEDELERLFKVNTIVPVILTRKLVDIIPKGGKVVFVISGAVFINSVDLPSYGASKAALHYLAINLERELRNSGIHVIRIYPKQVATSFWKRIPKGSIPPEKVANAIIEAIHENKNEVFIPAYIKIAKHLPRWPAFDYKFKF